MLKTQRQIVLHTLLAVIALIGMICIGKNVKVYASELSASTVTWVFEETTGTLTISGIGAMDNYESIKDVPWYDNRYAIKSVVISEEITSIGQNAFNGCSELTQIDLGNVQVIERTAFKDCISLSKIELPNTLQTLGDSFMGCTGLTEVIIPESVILMQGQTFGGCTNLSKMVVKSTVLKCEKFSYYYEIGPLNGAGINGIEVEFPEGLMEIPTGFFYGCPGIISTSDIVIPDTVTSIGASAFENCNNLNNVIIPDTVVEIKDAAFSGCSNLKELDLGSAQIIGRTAFKDCTSLSALVLPDTITTLGDSFMGCTGLTQVTIPESVILMQGQTFGGCTSLSQVIVKSTVLQCKKYSYYYEIGPFNGAGINGMKFEFPKGLTEIPTGFFYGCQGIISTSDIVIPDTVTSIGASAFENCTNLAEVVIPQNVAEIKESTFSACNNLVKLNLGNVKTIGRKAFENCISLQEVAFPDTLQVICDSFIGCTSLTTVTIPESVTSLRGETFGNCTNLESVVVKNKDLTCTNYYTDIGPLSGAGVNGISVELPSGMTEIPFSFFFGCPGIRTFSDIVLPDTVTSIGARAFEKCTNLTNVVLPETITTIGENSFKDCENLTDIECPITIQKIGSSAFASDNIVLHVYRDSYVHNYAIENFINYVLYNSTGEINIELMINSSVYESEEMVIDQGSLSKYDVTLYNTTKKQEIPVLLSRSGIVSYDTESCNVGDELFITLTNTDGTTTDGTATVQLDEKMNSAAEITVDELGYIEFEFTKDNIPVRFICFDENGNLLFSKSLTKKSQYTTMHQKEGIYQYVITSSYSMCWNVNRFSDLEKYGYQENINYIRKEVEVKNSLIKQENLGDIPILETGLLNALDHTQSTIYIDDSMYHAYWSSPI